MSPLNSHVAIVLGLNATGEEARLAIDLIERAFASKLAGTPAASEVRAQAGATVIPTAPVAPTTTNDDDDDSASNTGIPASAVNADGTVVLDAEGLPWHADLHSSKGTMTKAGVFTKRKNRDESTAAKVIAELRAKFPDPTAAAPVAVTAPTVTVNTPTIAVNVQKTPYQEFIGFLTNNTGAVLTQEIIDTTLQQNNTSLAALATANQETLDAFKGAFVGYLQSNGATVV